MKELVRPIIKYLRPVMLLVALLVFIRLLVNLGARDSLEVVRGLSPWWVLATLVSIMLNFIFAARRYQVLVAGDLPFLKVFETIMASFLLNYASMIQGLGIGAKVGMMKADGIAASRSIAGVITEIVFDLGFSVAMCAVFAVVADHPADIIGKLPSPGPVLLVGSVMLAVAVAAGVMFRQFLSDVLAHLKQINSRHNLGSVVMTTSGIWVVAGLGFYCMLNALEGGSSASLFLCIFAITTGFITGLVSMVPGGIGIREITWAYIVSLSGVSIEVAGLIALIYRVLSIAVILLVLMAWRALPRLGFKRSS
ncbi:MAG TPA: lysylphosphatidylglycerol synthase domain-containing protein [Candidatus Acidoferrum sp.]|nr:lysylphosphatidylglycerol synthase domain-containing protein [Candidatus Acidoferrum sp.]